MRLNAFFSENDVNCAKVLYFALKTRFMHIIGLKAMKALGTCKRIEFCKNGRFNAKSSSFLFLHAFFSKKRTLNALNRVITRKKAFNAHYRF